MTYQKRLLKRLLIGKIRLFRPKIHRQMLMKNEIKNFQKNEKMLR